MTTTTEFNFRLKDLSLIVLCLTALPLFAQQSNSYNERISVDWDVCKYFPEEETRMSSTPPSDEVLQRLASRGTNCSTFIVNYNGFTPAAEAAFQFAVDIWSNSLDSGVPIRVDANFGPLDPGVLGGAGPAQFIPLTVPGVDPNTAFPIALAEKITGAEIPNGASPTSIDINATFSSTANFYFGLDANPPGGQIDFVSVVLHELGHGLGIVGFGRVDDNDNPTQGELRFSNFTSIWDNFIENGTPSAITGFTDPSVDLLNEYTSNDLFCNGASATAENGSVKPSTYAPAVFRTGSSYSHWDEATYPAGNPNSLMTPFIAPGEAIHDPGLITLGFMEDMGWSICGGSLSINEFSIADVSINPNPFSSAFNLKLPNTFSAALNVVIFDINGREIVKVNDKPINGQLRISGLSQLQSGVYFVKIEDASNGINLTKKLIKN